MHRHLDFAGTVMVDSDVQSKVNLRSKEQHERQCNILKHGELSQSNVQHLSTTFGVNRRSTLMSLRYFEVTSGALLADIMHNFLEGLVPLEMKLMLKVIYCGFYNSFYRSLLITS